MAAAVEYTAGIGDISCEHLQLLFIPSRRIIMKGLYPAVLSGFSILLSKGV